MLCIFILVINLAGAHQREEVGKEVGDQSSGVDGQLQTGAVLRVFFY